MGVQLTIHARLAYAPRDKLRVLGTKIKNQDALRMRIGHELSTAGASKQALQRQRLAFNVRRILLSNNVR